MTSCRVIGRCVRQQPPRILSLRGLDGSDLGCNYWRRRRARTRLVSSESYATAKFLSSLARPEEEDWRATFRSSDYDDPWAAYVPYKDGELNGHKRHDLSSIMNGTWKRRRHGMNLEPMELTFRGVDAMEYLKYIDNSDNADGSCNKRIEVERAEITKYQNRLRWIDGQTRFLCRMLDDMYRTGTRREIDRPTTERCHRMIGKLLTMTPEDPFPKSEGIFVKGLAQRANEVLRRMESITPHTIRQLQLKSWKLDELDEDIVQVGSYQNAYQDYPRHLAFSKVALPTPTRAIYNMVLRSYAKEEGDAHVPEQAEDVTWSMIQRVMQLPQSYFASRGQDADILFPSIDNWNCVIECWSRSTDANRSLHAFSFTQAWKEFNSQCERDQSLQYRIGSQLSKPDEATYHSVLDACLVDDDVERGHVESNIQRAKEIGSGVSIKVWNDLQQSNIEVDSELYCKVIQAICQTSQLPSAKSTTRSLAALARVFSRCNKDGMINPEISRLVRANMTASQFTQLTAKLRI